MKKQLTYLFFKIWQMSQKNPSQLETFSLFLKFIRDHFPVAQLVTSPNHSDHIVATDITVLLVLKWVFKKTFFE